MPGRTNDFRTFSAVVTSSILSERTFRLLTRPPPAGASPAAAAPVKNIAAVIRVRPFRTFLLRGSWFSDRLPGLRPGANRRAQPAHDGHDEDDGNMRTIRTEGCVRRSKMMRRPRPTPGHPEGAAYSSLVVGRPPEKIASRSGRVIDYSVVPIRRPSPRRKVRPMAPRYAPLRAYAAAALAVGVALLVRWAAGPVFGARTPYVTVFPVVLLCAYLGGPGPGLLATVLGAAGAVLFLPEPLAGAAADPQTLSKFLIGGTGVVILSEAIRRARRRAAQR